MLLSVSAGRIVRDIWDLICRKYDLLHGLGLGQDSNDFQSAF